MPTRRRTVRAAPRRARGLATRGARPGDARRARARRRPRVDLERALERAQGRGERERRGARRTACGDTVEAPRDCPRIWCLRADDDGFVEETMNAELCYVSGRAKGRAGRVLGGLISAGTRRRWS